MKVMKFGGGCLRTAADFTRVVQIIKSEKETPVVVLSAISGVTDILQDCLMTAGCDELQVGITARKLRELHTAIARDLIRDKDIRKHVLNSIDSRVQKVERLLYGVSYTEEVTDRIRALVRSFGERLCVVLMAGALASEGIPASAFDADELGLVTDDSYENATADLATASRNLRRMLIPILKKKTVPVITGYFGCTADGRTTTFGRNGSDYGAAVMARALDAACLEVWKDVDGFMTADPKLVPQAREIETLSYYEAAELSYFGARILHPRTVEPLLDTDMPIHIKSVMSPSAPGTVIRRGGYEKEDVVKSVTCNRDIAVLKVSGAGVGHKPGIIAEIGKRLSDCGINIFSVITSQTVINLLIHKNDAARGLEALEKLGGGVIERVAVHSDVSLIAVVGEGLLRTKGLAARVFTAVAREKINVEMISAGASEVAYYFIVGRDRLEMAVGAVHSEFFGKK